MSVKINIEYLGNLKCVATHLDSGAKLETEAPKDNGGEGSLFSPTDLVATGLASCIMTIMGAIADRRGIDIKGLKIEATKHMATGKPRRISKIELSISFPSGLNLSDEDKKRIEHAIEICPVKQSIHPDIEVATKIMY